ncbi:alpha-ketoglutarate-dependent dioxygenase AlkB family protein [Rhodophyticola porphyridii]|uniref:Alpha-ketoglutarate-dependent dioxygenase AlkB n=1 Tax=Rhodophyticola porphyridii TaxID=1852017 RepID=A0A3L9Y9B5_9RHOB|nr:alpha-ketoglutarate-dependent dioxygenase AlkB [Rhodophyticola porphyridii]RMA42823.1 alpha-ketoglutarate-dependent dioxygenase AlkB [Rhodophyticola porphyridii]
MPDLNLRGVRIHTGFLDPAEQAAMVEDIREVMRAAPLFRPQTPYGKQMSVRMTAAGQFGWFSDKSGYRYVDRHPSGMAWPAIPPSILRVWTKVSDVDRDPECCLVNFYADGARMGLHQDKDEADFSMPVVSISLGDDALFRVGGLSRGGTTESVWLKSGDVAVLAGDARLLYHGVDRTRTGSSALLPKGGRINLTLRVVN